MTDTANIDRRINELLEQLEPITLEQMKESRLMNRTDTKFVTTTFLEVKTKNNHRRTKKKRIKVESQNVRADEIGDMKGCAIMVDDFLREQVCRNLEEIHPTVQNRFHRITLVNYGKSERLTIDFDIQFHNFDTDREDNTGNLVIVELKRDGNVYSPILAMLRDLRIKPHGFSKYCIGSVLTNPDLKRNRFKPKLKSLQKISENK